MRQRGAGSEKSFEERGEATLDITHLEREKRFRHEAGFCLPLSFLLAPSFSLSLCLCFCLSSLLLSLPFSSSLLFSSLLFFPLLFSSLLFSSLLFSSLLFSS